MEHFPQFYALSICFQTLPPFLLWMALIPFPPEVNGTSLNKFPKETTKFCIHPENTPQDATFWGWNTQRCSPCRNARFPPSSLITLLFPGSPFTQLPLSILAEANGCFKLQLSTEAVWPLFNHHAKPNSSSHFYFSEHGPEALK